MKKFQFSLEALLEMRKRQEDIAYKELRIAQEFLDRLATQLAASQQEYRSLEEELRQRQRSHNSPEEIPTYHAYFQLLKARIAQQQDAVIRAQNAAAARREELTKAMRDKKIIENLKDKQYAAWEAEKLKSEAASIDELATIRHLRDKERLKHEE